MHTVEKLRRPRIILFRFLFCAIHDRLAIAHGTAQNSTSTQTKHRPPLGICVKFTIHSRHNNRALLQYGRPSSWRDFLTLFCSVYDWDQNYKTRKQTTTTKKARHRTTSYTIHMIQHGHTTIIQKYKKKVNYIPVSHTLRSARARQALNCLRQ